MSWLPRCKWPVCPTRNMQSQDQFMVIASKSSNNKHDKIYMGGVIHGLLWPMSHGLGCGCRLRECVKVFDTIKSVLQTSGRGLKGSNILNMEALSRYL